MDSCSGEQQRFIIFLAIKKLLDVPLVYVIGDIFILRKNTIQSLSEAYMRRQQSELAKLGLFRSKCSLNSQYEQEE